MPRPPRITFPNAWYHVMNRGAGRRPIFRTETHRYLFLELLEETCELHKIEVHAYCLMTNHFHFLVRTPDCNISDAMKHLQAVYTRRFNRSERLDGPLFRGRFKTIVVDADDYLLQVSRYIHLNPVEARITNAALEYPWSSYQHYLDTTQKPKWLYIEEILGRASGRENYQKLVENARLPSLKEFYRQTHIPMILGNRQFRKTVMACSSLLIERDPLPPVHRSDLDRLFQNDSFTVSQQRAISMLMARSLRISLKEIAAEFKIGTSAVSMAVSRAKQLVAQNKGERIEIEVLTPCPDTLSQNCSQISEQFSTL